MYQLFQRGKCHICVFCGGVSTHAGECQRTRLFPRERSSEKETCAFLQGLGPYCVSKTALLGLTRVLAPELAQSNIRVNCVAPGIIKTRFSAAVSRNMSPARIRRGVASRSHFCLSHQLWENEAIVDEFKKQLSIKRCGLRFRIFTELLSRLCLCIQCDGFHPSGSDRWRKSEA